MKGISVQLDSLSDLLRKNINNKELLHSKDNFDMVYQKITQQAFKTINTLVQNHIDDFSLKLSFSKLLKQLKTFLSLKPQSNDDQQQDFYNQQYDQVQQFMNNRKPVIPDQDTGQRGDIYKFLYQAENKSKDIEEFMGNVNKFNPKGNKKFQLTNHKWKKTLKQLPVITEDIETQTQLNLQIFQKLQKQLPGLLMPNITNHQNQKNLQNKQEYQQSMDIQAKIQQIINKKIQQKTKAQDKAIQQKQAQERQTQQKKKQTDKKKKKPTQSNNKRNSENNQKKNNQTNQKRNSNNPQSVGTSLKSKSQFANSKKSTLPNQNAQKITTLQPIFQLTKQDAALIKENSIKQNSIINLINQQNSRLKSSNPQITNLQSAKRIEELVPSFQNFMKIMSQSQGLSEISQQQIKIIYQIMKTQLTQKIINNKDLNSNTVSFSQQNLNSFGNLNVNCEQNFSQNKKETSQKQVNTENSYFDQIQKDNKGNQIKKTDSRSRFFSKDSNISQKNNDQNRSSQTDCLINKDYPQTIGFQKNKNSQFASNSTSIYDSKNQKHPQFQSQLNSTELKKNQDSFKQKSSLNGLGQLKNSLPQLFKSGDVDKLIKIPRSDSADLLAKQGRSADQYLKKLKDAKQIISPQNSKFFNKQNYTLDMYKSKDFLPKNRASQHVNLPSLNRKTIKQNISLHQQIDNQEKNPHLKKTGKKITVHHSTIQPLNLDQKDEEHEHEIQIRRSKTKNSNSDLKEEEKIMNELSKISNEGSAKMNLKNIAMYINCVQKIHLRRCGEKCIHLERFFGFLQRNNIPNRKQLFMHKADMNSNVKI